MFSLLFPYEYVDSVFSLDYKKLLQKGYKGIIFDIDMTLVPHGADSTAEIDAEILIHSTFVMHKSQIRNVI